MPNKACITTKHLRNMIKADELIKVLQDNALHPRRAPLHQNRVNAIKCLLGKVLPDLKSVEQTVDVQGEVDLSVKVEFIE